MDDFLRECSAIEADTSLDGVRIVHVFERLSEMRGLQGMIIIDNGAEFIGQALNEWVYRRGMKPNFIRPGNPIENVFMESFIGRLRDECLNENWFMSVKHAREVIEAWRNDYNSIRPHGSSEGLIPKNILKLSENSIPSWP